MPHLEKFRNNLLVTAYIQWVLVYRDKCVKKFQKIPIFDHLLTLLTSHHQLNMYLMQLQNQFCWCLQNEQRFYIAAGLEFAFAQGHGDRIKNRCLLLNHLVLQ